MEIAGLGYIAAAAVGAIATKAYSWYTSTEANTPPPPPKLTATTESGYIFIPRESKPVNRTHSDNGTLLDEINNKRLSLKKSVHIPVQKEKGPAVKFLEEIQEKRMLILKK